jgi:hypothetical protein
MSPGVTRPFGNRLDVWTDFGGNSDKRNAFLSRFQRRLQGPTYGIFAHLLSRRFSDCRVCSGLSRPRKRQENHRARIAGDTLCRFLSGSSFRGHGYTLAVPMTAHLSLLGIVPTAHADFFARSLPSWQKHTGREGRLESTLVNTFPSKVQGGSRELQVREQCRRTNVVHIERPTLFNNECQLLPSQATAPVTGVLRDSTVLAYPAAFFANFRKRSRELPMSFLSGECF